MAIRRSPSDIAASVVRDMETQLTVQGYRNFHRKLVREIALFSRSKKIRDVEASSHKTNK